MISSFTFFFFNDTATTEIYTLSLHDALPICVRGGARGLAGRRAAAAHLRNLRRSRAERRAAVRWRDRRLRSEEHTSELQSRSDLVCRLLLEKKKQKKLVNLHTDPHHVCGNRL